MPQKIKLGIHFRAMRRVMRCGMNDQFGLLARPRPSEMVEEYDVKVELLVEYVVTQEWDLAVSSGQDEMEGKKADKPCLQAKRDILTVPANQSIAAISSY